MGAAGIGRVGTAIHYPLADQPPPRSTPAFNDPLCDAGGEAEAGAVSVAGLDCSAAAGAGGDVDCVGVCAADLGEEEPDGRGGFGGDGAGGDFGSEREHGS